MPHYLVEILVSISNLDVNKMTGDYWLCDLCCVLACPHGGDEHGMLPSERQHRQLTWYVHMQISILLGYV